MKTSKWILTGGLIFSLSLPLTGPLQAQSKPPEPKPGVAAPKAPSFPDGTLLKSDENRAVYVMKKGKRVLIPDPETFNAHKYNWDRIKKVEIPVLKSIPLGQPMPSVKNPVKKS